MSPIIEIVELIVIDYANLSGRETTNRAEFRERVVKHLEQLKKFFQNKRYNKLKAQVENCLDYCSQQNVLPYCKNCGLNNENIK
mgnify:CR=1 FL=1